MVELADDMFETRPRPNEFAWVVLPLLRCVPVENGWTYVARWWRAPFDFLYRVELFQREFQAPELVQGAHAIEEILNIALRPRLKQDDAEQDSAADAGDSEIPTHEQGGAQENTSSNALYETWAVVCVPIHDIAETNRSSIALDRAISALNEVLLGFAGVLDVAEGAVSEVRSTDIHSIIPILFGRANDDGGGTIKDVCQQFMLSHALQQNLKKFNRSQRFNAERLVASIDSVVRDTPFTSYKAMRRKAHETLKHRGDFQLAAICIGSAGEILLDTLLLLLMWEDGLDPAQGSHEFGDMLFKMRVTSLFHKRLKGCDWTLATGPIAEFFTTAVNLRNLTAHTGYEPAFPEVDLAFAMLLKMERHLVDVVSDDLNRGRFPRSASLSAGVDGLTRRGRMTRKISQVSNDAMEPDWASAFANWRFHFRRERKGGPVPGAGQLSFYAEISSDLSIDWVLHDFEAGYAVQVTQPENFTSEQCARSITSNAQLLKSKAKQLDIVRVDVWLRPDTPAEVFESLQWKRDFEVIREKRLWRT